MDNILNDVKKFLGIDPEITDFDTELLALISTVISTLTQLGIGPVDLMVDVDTPWATLIGSNSRYISAKTYIHLKVKTIFDPPTSSYALDAMKEHASELEWRLSILAEGVTA